MTHSLTDLGFAPPKASQTLQYDIIIIGGGLSGLYSAYKIYQTQPNVKVLLLECENRLGGRIYTYEDDIYGKIEAGAARFNKKHKHVIKLLSELGLESKINPIPPDIGYMPIRDTTISTTISTTTTISDSAVITHTPKDIKNITNKILQKAQEIVQQDSIKVLQNMIFMDYIKQVLSKEEAQLYYDSFGYSSELTFMNAYDTIELIKNHFASKQFLNLKGGLIQIIEALVAKLSKQTNLTIKTNQHVNDIQYTHATQLFNISSNKNNNYQSKVCICTLNKETIEHFPIFRPIKPLLKYIKNLPLCRIYSKFSPNPATHEPWFKGKHKFTTNNQLRMVIPMNADRGTVMSTYSDNHYAKSWYKLYKTKGIEAVNKKIHQLLIQSVASSSVTAIPPPTHTKIFYWEHAVAYYGKGFDSTTMLSKIRTPYPDIPLYVCGENYSEKNNQWMEGSLDTIPDPRIFLSKLHI